MPERKDHWWQVSTSTDLTDLASNVLGALTAHAIPFFAGYRDTAAILRTLREVGVLPGLAQAQVPIVHAMLAHDRGLSEEAAAQIQRALVQAGNSPFKGTVQVVGRRLGVL